jgi:hypothetical protein
VRIRLSATLAAAILVVPCPAAAAEPAWNEAPALPVTPDATSSILNDVTALSPTEVWAAGSWWDAKEHPLVARWDGTDWTNLSAPDAPEGGETYRSLAAVDATAAGDVWAAGTTESPSSNTPLILHQDGAAWQVADLPAGPGILNDVDMRSADDGWAVGQTSDTDVATQPLILQMRSGAWVRVKAPAVAPSARLTSVFAAPAGDAWAAGTQTSASGRQSALVLFFNGTDWTPVTVPTGRGTTTAETLQSISGTNAADVWAVGSTCGTLDTSSCSPLVLHFVRGVWQPVPTATGARLTEVVPFSGSDVWVFGENVADETSGLDHVEHWDGHAFTVDTSVPGVLPPESIDGQPASALALAGAAGDRKSGLLWAVGWTGDATARVPHAIYRN